MGDRFGTDMSSGSHELCQLTEAVCPNLGHYAEIAVRINKIYNYQFLSLFLITDYLCVNAKNKIFVDNIYAKIPPLVSFHAGCDRNRSVESPEVSHRIGTRRGGVRSIGNFTTAVME